MRNRKNKRGLSTTVASLRCFALLFLFTTVVALFLFATVNNNNSDGGRLVGDNDFSDETTKYHYRNPQINLKQITTSMVTAERSSLIKKEEGSNWTMWDGQSVLHQELGIHCHYWRDYVPYLPPNSNLQLQTASMCLPPRRRDKALTATIFKTGRWPDCDALTRLLCEDQNHGPVPIHIEIGANIGACILQILLTTNAEIYAFEPHPRNLFHLTSTLINMDSSYRDRVHLFPIALGSERSMSSIEMNRKNGGNAQVQAAGIFARVGARSDVYNIQIEAMDDVLHQALEDKTRISLIKMDAQGYECFIMSGMTKLMKKTQRVVFEVETNQFRRFKRLCSPKILVDSIKSAGFDVERMQVAGKDENRESDLPDFTNFDGAIDLIGTRRQHMDSKQ